MTPPGSERKKFCLIDGSSYFFRAYYAIARLSNKSGFPTNAIFGFANMLQKVLNDEKPAYLAVIYDSKGPTFRKKMYDAYKANRTEMPEDLALQIPEIKALVAAENIHSLELAGYEADDLIATIIKRFQDRADIEFSIVSSDKDLMQLVNAQVSMLDTMKNLRYGPAQVQEKMGVVPERVRDVLALAGDSSDNIPGVPGIGLKTAAALISQFGSLDELFAQVDQVKGDSKREKLKAHQQDAKLSEQLITLCDAVPVDFTLDEFSRRPANAEALLRLYERFDFKQLAEKMRGAVGAPVETPAAVEIQENFREKYRLILTPDDLRKYLQPIREHRLPLAVDTETTSLNAMQAKLVGVSLCAKAGEGVYVPVGHRQEGIVQMPQEALLAELQGILTDASHPKLGQNLKYDLVVLLNQGLRLRGLQFDSMLASYLLDAQARGTHNLDALAERYLNHKNLSFLDMTAGLAEPNFSLVPVDKALLYAAEDADVVFRLMEKMTPLLAEENTLKLLQEVECPLSEILAQVEFTGIGVDRQRLEILSKEFEQEIGALTQTIYAAAGGPFLINSPKQLQHILFEKMGLPKGRKIKTGYSTDNEVLEDLAREFEIASHLVRYRALTKLKNTYVDVLPSLIHPVTGRIHTTFNQAIAATGRLSSSDPNLQNIPVRGEDGQRIREAFVPKAGCKLLAADYSQVELRVFAHFSQDPQLLKAYREGLDIHQMTAQAIFNCSPNAVDRDMRRKAKTVNFGILYGISDFGLSRQLKTSPKEAKEFIERYFLHYQGVKTFLESVIRQARAQGYAQTFLGRRRKLPDLETKNIPLRRAAERMAVSTVIQGSAADLIKVAMINLYRKMETQGFASTMTLQVHDELLFDVAPAEEKSMMDLVQQEMQQAFALSVPLQADVRLAANWLEAH